MNLEELEKKRKRNREQRREFIKYWANYIKNHEDKEWSKQQNVIIDSQISKSEEEE